VGSRRCQTIASISQHSHDYFGLECNVCRRGYGSYVRGDLDTQVPIGDIQDLLGDLTAVPQKVFVHVACASHYMVWENQHMALLNASVEWLQQGTYDGQFNGAFAVDVSGQIQQEQ